MQEGLGDQVRVEEAAGGHGAVSGAVSVLAGGSFIAGASADAPTLTNAIGYAVPGGVFFLISALRLGRAEQRT
ncbi:hypothetical protein [Actinomadura sp. WAC 06369]|uniref:hypothetical protein n=1 Tax=Actinomadura sp. WAC 06369 TaxID=2203193 RepID=UPI000F7A581A|nr:hypothetical protein [Actinomadura sp. WAC 06369]RSN71819.1 hypothetical protein DMH08_01740 [Actinomadura sp. WAC 06369]